MSFFPFQQGNKIALNYGKENPFEYLRSHIFIMLATIWRRVLSKVLLILVITAPASIIFWVWFGKDLLIRFGYLEIDFFNTVCGMFTIIGLIIALYQIAGLKSENEIREDAIADTLESQYKTNAIISLDNLRKQLIDFQEKVAFDTYTKDAISRYLNQISKIINEINSLHNAQKGLRSFPIIDCESCLPLLGELINECDRVSFKGIFGEFRKPFFITKKGEAISRISECEEKLKK
jgi:hypothetical protein